MHQKLQQTETTGLMPDALKGDLTIISPQIFCFHQEADGDRPIGDVEAAQGGGGGGGRQRRDDDWGEWVKKHGANLLFLFLVEVAVGCTMAGVQNMSKASEGGLAEWPNWFVCGPKFTDFLYNLNGFISFVSKFVFLSFFLQISCVIVYGFFAKTWRHHLQ